MLYKFFCRECEHVQDEMFSANDYDDYVVDGGDEDGRLKDGVCEKCQSNQLFRTIMKAPGVLGGTSNYMSMERYWEKNKGEARQREDKLSKTLRDRHEKRVKSRIDKQQRSEENRKNRHEGYGKGQGEEKLS